MEKDRLAYAYSHVFLRVYRHTTEKDRLTYAYLHVFLRIASAKTGESFLGGRLFTRVFRYGQIWTDMAEYGQI